MTIIIKDTLEAWKPFYEEELSEFDARQIQNNLLEFADCLKLWQDAKEQCEKNKEIAL